MPERTLTHLPEAHAPAEETETRRGLFASGAAVVAALGASLCCVGPLIFVTFGVGAGLASTFEPLRPLFTALTMLGLGFGFYTVYARPEEACGPGETCERPRNRRRDKILLWGATVLAIALWSFNYWSILLI